MVAPYPASCVQSRQGHVHEWPRMSNFEHTPVLALGVEMELAHGICTEEDLSIQPSVEGTTATDTQDDRRR